MDDPLEHIEDMLRSMHLRGWICVPREWAQGRFDPPIEQDGYGVCDPREKKE